jgi:hypothetical protein
MRRIRQHLTFANVVSVIALFVALGGTALASVIITSNSQVAQGTISGHKPPSGDHANIIAGSINGQDVANNSIGGGKIVKFSGVDACTPTLLAKFGRICAGSDGGLRNWANALLYCSGLGLRLPSVSEAITLARNYSPPGVGTGEYFWTSNDYFDGTDFKADIVRKDGVLGSDGTLDSLRTVCVAVPTN